MILRAIALAALLPLSSQAAQLDTDACAAAGELAGLIMKNRQEGTPLSTMLQDTGEVVLIRRLVLIAYSVQRFTSISARNDAAETFQTMVELECYKLADAN